MSINNIPARRLTRRLYKNMHRDLLMSPWDEEEENNMGGFKPNGGSSFGSAGGAKVISMAQSTLHKLFKGELEMYLMSQYPGFKLLSLPDSPVVKLHGSSVPKNAQSAIDAILDHCDKKEGMFMRLRCILPSYKQNRELIIKKMRRKGLHKWFLKNWRNNG